MPATKKHNPKREPQGLDAIPKLLRKSLQFYTDNWSLFLPIIFIGIFPSLFANLFLQSMRPLYILVSLIGLASNIWASTAVFYAFREVVLGHKLSISQAFAKSRDHIIPFTLTGLLTALLIVGGLLLFIVPGIILLVWGFASVFVYFFEQTSYIAAFQRSRQLVAGHFWDVFQRLVVLLLIVVGINVVVAPYMPDKSLQQMLIESVFALLIPLFVIHYTYSIYKNLRDNT